MGRFYIPLKKGIKQTPPDFNQIKTISGNKCFYYMFTNNEYRGVINFANLETVSGEDSFTAAFSGSKYITEVRFPKLVSCVSNRSFYGAFQRCESLLHIYFSAFTTTYAQNNVLRMAGMLTYTVGCTVHFPSNLQSTLENYRNVTDGFGGTNTTVLFDLPATS